MRVWAGNWVLQRVLDLDHVGSGVGLVRGHRQALVRAALTGPDRHGVAIAKVQLDAGALGGLHSVAVVRRAGDLAIDVVGVVPRDAHGDAVAHRRHAPAALRAGH